MHRTGFVLSLRSYGTIKVEPEVECVQRVNDYIAWVMCCQAISKRDRGRIALYLVNYLESKKSAVYVRSTMLPLLDKDC